MGESLLAETLDLSNRPTTCIEHPILTLLRKLSRSHSSMLKVIIDSRYITITGVEVVAQANCYEIASIDQKSDNIYELVLRRSNSCDETAVN